MPDGGLNKKRGACGGFAFGHPVVLAAKSLNGRVQRVRHMFLLLYGGGCLVFFYFYPGNLLFIDGAVLFF